jgi:hypothetical protein
MFLPSTLHNIKILFEELALSYEWGRVFKECKNAVTVEKSWESLN